VKPEIEALNGLLFSRPNTSAATAYRSIGSLVAVTRLTRNSTWPRSRACRASTFSSGRVALRRYLDEARMVAADNLNPQKARILLMLALAQTRDIDEIRRMFTAY
jgi:L-asparaginase/Glu-tRNA(Gln) amidotransferase subunit D